MAKVSQTKLGVALSYIMIAVANILSLILIPIIIRYIGQDEYGIYATIGSLAGLMVVLDFGMGSTVARYVAKYRAENDIEGEERFLATSMIIYIVIAVFIILVGIIASNFIDVLYRNTFTAEDFVLAKRMFMVLIINIAINLPLNCFSAYLNGREMFVFPRLLSVIRVIIRFAVIILLLNLGFKSLMIVVVDTILNFTMQLLIMVYTVVKMKLRIKIGKFDKEFVKEIGSFSFIIFLTMVYDQIFWKVDQLIVGSMLTKSAVTICSLGVQLNVYYMRFSTAISEVFLPRVTAMVTKGAKGKELTNFMIKVGRIQMLIMGLIFTGVAIFGRTFYRVWQPNVDNIDTAWIICIIVMIPLTVPLIQNMGIAILRAMNKHRFRSFVYFGIAVLNVFVTIFLVDRFGILGAPVATALALTLGNIVIINIYYSRVVGIEVMRFFKETVASFAPLIVIMLGLGYLIQRFMLMESFSSLLIWIAAFTCVYLLIARLMVLNDYEKHLFSRTIAKLKGFVKS